MCAMKCSDVDAYGFDIPLPNCADLPMEDTIETGTTNAAAPADQDKQVAQQVQKTTGQCKRPTPAQRLKTYLQRAKAARLVKEHQAKHPPQEPHDAKQDIPAAWTPQKPSDGSTPTVENANGPADAYSKTTTVESKNLSNFKELYNAHVTALPDLPKDWEATAYVSADQQQPPKKRGRKPKAPAETKPKAAPKRRARGQKKAQEMEASPESNAKEVKAKAATDEAEPPAKKTKRASPKSAPRAKRTKTNTAPAAEPSEHTAAKALDMIPIPTPARANAKPPSMTTSKASNYEAHELDDECNKFDAYAVASASSDVAKLGHNSSMSNTSSSCNEASSSMPIIDAPSNPDKDDTPHGAEETTEDDRKSKAKLEQKKRYSRKSCAYKKAKTEALKNGKTQEEAAAAAKKVSYLLNRYFYLWCIQVFSRWSPFKWIPIQTYDCALYDS